MSCVASEKRSARIDVFGSEGTIGMVILRDIGGRKMSHKHKSRNGEEWSKMVYDWMENGVEESRDGRGVKSGVENRRSKAT